MKESLKKYDEFVKEKGIYEEKNISAIIAGMQQVIGEILIDNEKIKGQLQKMQADQKT